MANKSKGPDSDTNAVCERKLRIAFVSEEDPNDPRSWSGIPFQLSKALAKNGAQVLNTCVSQGRTSVIGRLTSVLGQKPTGPLGSRYTRRRLQEVARSAEASIRRLGDLDFIISCHPDPLAYATMDVPWGFVGDATFDLISEQYAAFKSLNDSERRIGREMWRAGLLNASAAFLSSEWAAMNAISSCPDQQGKIYVVPFGANAASGWTVQDWELAITHRCRRPLQLLSVGVDWRRKGMDDACELLTELIKHGIPSELTIVGCHPPSHVKLTNSVRLVGRLSLSDPHDLAKLRSLFSTADFFLLPSRADCTPVVLAEAASYGLPAVVTDVGGMSSMTLHELTGYVVSRKNYATEGAAWIASKIRCSTTYSALSREAYTDYRDRLNWDRVAQVVLSVISSVIANRLDR